MFFFHLGNVITEKEIFIQMKSRGVLPCHTDRELFAISWVNEYKVLVSSEEINGKWVKSGQGHIDGFFDIGESCSLIINTVSIADEGLYTVTVGEKTTGKVFVNLTNVVVYGK